MTSAQEVYLMNNTLVVILKMCLGQTTCVELRDESHVIGKVVEVDGFMNVTLEEARYYDPRRNSQKFDSFFVQNRLIRFVQIPQNIDIKEGLRQRFDPAARGEKDHFFFGRRDENTVTNAALFYRSGTGQRKNGARDQSWTEEDHGQPREKKTGRSPERPET